MNGDIIIEMGSISLRDKATERSGVPSDSDAGNDKEDTNDETNSHQIELDTPAHVQDSKGTES